LYTYNIGVGYIN